MTAVWPLPRRCVQRRKDDVQRRMGGFAAVLQRCGGVV